MPHSYIFFDIVDTDLDRYKKEFVTCIRSASKRGVRIASYGTLAFKPDTRFMLHIAAAGADEIQSFVSDLLHTKLGKKLRIAHSLLGLTRPSPYNPKHTPLAEPTETTERKYLVVYPFTKTIEWHLKPHDERLEIMKAHVAVGRKYHDKISQLLLYSYGIDDQEFIVSYECDDLLDFQSLVMELRGTEARRYTLNDTPIFTCVRMTIEETLRLV